MGILGLSKLIADVCPEAIREQDVGAYFGRKIAVDASMAIYQFLIAIRVNNNMNLTNEEGESTSHLIGLFYRTCKLLESGILPIYVFDGKAPELKSGELEKRKERREQAEEKLKEAKERGEDIEITKFTKRVVRVTRKHNEDCQKLLRLMGIPIILAPSEAEAQCAQLCKEGLVYGIASEDMDGLTFGTLRLIRHLSSGRADKVKEYAIDKVLSGLGLTTDQFIDLCILMGCDYCDSIKGIGGKKGLELIRKYGSIEEILRNRFNIDPSQFDDVKTECKPEPEKDDKEIVETNGGTLKKEENSDSDEDMAERILRGEDEDVKASESEEDEMKEEVCSDEKEEEEVSSKKKKSKVPKSESVPENWMFKRARQLFTEPEVDKNKYTEADLKTKDIDEEGLIEFLCKQNGFSEERVRSGIRRVKESKGKSSQTRIDSFFKAIPNTTPKTGKPTKDDKSSAKRSNTGKGSTSKRGRPR